METDILIKCNWSTMRDLEIFLEKCEGWHSEDIKVEVPPRIRGVDPQLLVAIVSMTGVGLGALISGVLAVARQSTTKKVVIQGKNGAKLEIPANTSPHKVDYWIAKLKEIDVQSIEI